MILDKIFDIFPPPKSLNIPFAGISISDSVIHCIKFRKKGGKLFVDKYTHKDISPGLIKSGQIDNKDEIVQVLKDMKRDLGLEYVKLSLPEEKGYLFTAKIPMVEQKEVRSAIESKMEENVPVSPAELTFDYVLMKHQDQEHLKVIVSAVPISVVDTYVGLAETAELSLLSLEIESQATARALLPQKSQQTVLVVNFEKGKVGLYVVNNTLVHFTSTLLFKDDVSSNLDFISQEIKKLFEYWHTLKENVNKEDRVIKQIIICGEGFDEDITSYFTTQNKTTTILGNVWTNVLDINSSVPPISFVESLGYVTCIGLALSDDVLI